MSSAARSVDIAGSRLTTDVPVADGAAKVDPLLRDQLSNLRGLLVLSMVMTESTDERQILDLATRAVPSLGRCHVAGVRLVNSGWHATSPPCAEPDLRVAVGAQLHQLGGGGGMLAIQNEQWD